MPALSSVPVPEPAAKAVGSRYKWIALSNTTLGVRGKRYIHELHGESAVESAAALAGAGPAGWVAAKAPGNVRLAIAEEIQEPSGRRSASPEPALRSFKER